MLRADIVRPAMQPLAQRQQLPTGGARPRRSDLSDLRDLLVVVDQRLRAQLPELEMAGMQALRNDIADAILQLEAFERSSESEASGGEAATHHVGVQDRQPGNETQPRNCDRGSRS